MTKTTYLLYILTCALLVSCGGAKKNNLGSAGEAGQEQQARAEAVVTLSANQVRRMGITVGPMTDHPFAGWVEANGTLEADPRSVASVTPVVGANVQRILVSVGQTVGRGQVVAYLAHPDLVEVQSRYLAAVTRQDYLRREYRRQQLMMDERVGVGKDLDRAKADLQEVSGEVSMLAAQMRQMGLDPAAARRGKPTTTVPVRSPIAGTVERIDVETGQYAAPEQPMMRIVNTDHLYADLLVYQRDVARVRAGQAVRLSMVSDGGDVIKGRVYSVGKTLTEDTRGVHVRVSLQGGGGLVSKQYVQGRIAAGETRALAVPAAAVVEEDGKYYVFAASDQGERTHFVPVAVKRVREEDGWVAIEPLADQGQLQRVALSGAYYLLSELRKGETGEE